jgi:exosortase/archaeosortase family protein
MVNLYFRIGGVHFIREGSTFHLENLSFFVAGQCSGIHSGISLLIVSIIAGKLFLKRPGMKIILALSVVPIGWIKNGMRIATLTLLGCYVNPGFMSGPLHRQGGRPFFILALLFLGLDLFILHRFEKSIGKKRATTPITSSRPTAAKSVRKSDAILLNLTLLYQPTLFFANFAHNVQA